MKFDNILPENFNGTFYFTNYTGEDFIGVWGKKEYLFKARTSAPMIMTEHTPLEIQNIRKKFAKDLAEREFYKSKGYDVLRSQEGTPGNRTMSGIHQAGTYSMNELTPFIQKCLEPLEVSEATIRIAPSVRLEEKLSKDEKDPGALNTAPVDGDKGLERLAKGEVRA